MRRRKHHPVWGSLSILIIILSYAPCLKGQQSVAGGTPAKREIYVIPFSHFDLFWAGTREECLSRGNRIIAKAIRIAKQYPEFRFLLESDNFVANYVETHPRSQELEDLKKLVKEGRFAIAPNWANIFHNLPSGEVHARNLLYGKRYAREVFGVNPRVFNPTDIPGFTPQFPQILNKTDTPFMVMSRMGPADKPLFNWESPDGSKELVWSVRGYGLGAHLQLHGDLTEDRINIIKKELEERYGAVPGPIFIHWGVDLWAPTEKLVENVDTLNRSLSSVHFTLGTPQDFFSNVGKEPDLPNLSGEIPMAWPHVVDGILHLWQSAVPATNTLTAAEKFAAINYALGYASYPQQEIDFLWKRLIESMDHNHDGQGGEIGDNRKMEYSQLAIAHGGEILREMLRNIAERVQIPIAKSFPVVVFNPLGWQRDDMVRAHVTLYGDVVPSEIPDYKKGLRLVDETGKPVSFFIEQTSDNISRAVDLVFVAKGVPSLGYKTYFLTAGHPETVSVTSQISLDREKDLTDPRRPLGMDTMENQFYRVTVDKATGWVTVFDKELNREICKEMQIVGIEERGSNNVQPEKDTGRTLPTNVNGTAVEENSAVRTVLTISGWIANIPIVQRLILYHDLKRFDIENSLDWREQRLIRIEQLFPVQQSHVEMYYGVPFGANFAKNVLPGSGPSANDEINKEAWEEYRTIQDWVFAGTPEWGLTLAADHQLIKLDDGLIRANMIRGQRYTSVRVVRGEEVTSIHFPANGHYVFRYSLSSGPGDWKALLSYRAGLNFNGPLIPVSVVDDISGKSLPPTYSFCSVQGDNLVISALKKSETDRSIILRFYEVQGAQTKTPVTFLGKQRDLHETDFLEQDLRPQAERILRVSPYAIETLKFKPEQ